MRSLNDEQATAILASKLTNIELAAQQCVPVHVIADIRRGRTYKHLGLPIEGERERRRSPRGADHCRAKLSPDQVATIRESPDRGIDLAERYGVTPGTISHIRTGRNWSEK